MKQGVKACLGSVCVCVCVCVCVGGEGHNQREGEGSLKTLAGRTVPAVGSNSSRPGKESLENFSE